MFENLKPYSSLLEGLASMDFDSFYEEVKKPPKDLTKRSLYKEVKITGSITLESVPEYEKLEQKNVEPDIYDENYGPLYSHDAMKKSLGIGEALVTDQYEKITIWKSTIIQNKADYDENLEEYIDEYSLMGLPLYEYSHVPLRIHNNTRLIDEHKINNGYLSHNEPLFNPNNPLVNKIYNKNNELDYLEVPLQEYPTFNEAIIKGFLFEIGFDYSPEQRDDVMNNLENIDNDSIDNEEAHEKEWIKFLEEICCNDQNSYKK